MVDARDGGATAQPADRARQFEELVVCLLDRVQDEGPQVVDELCREHPEFADALQERMELLRRIGMLPETESQAAMPERMGEFRLLRRLGAGAMGVVYLAEQETLRRQVALKLVRPELMFFPQAKERFLREVAAVARLQHPGIVPVHTFGEARSIPYFAMEYIAGCTLAQILESIASRNPATLTGADLVGAIDALTAPPETTAPSPYSSMSWVEATLRIAQQVGEALQHAHSRGVLHRDIKPSNVMVTREGRVMLVDFGLASAEGTDRLTRSGSQLGSVPYMAPEQIRGDADEIDQRTDGYALGVLLYEVLTLRLPYLSTNGEATRRLILQGEPVAPSRLNPVVTWEAETVCLTAMESDVGRRYATMAALVSDLRHVLERKPISARRPGRWLRATRWIERHKSASVAMALAVLLVVGGPLVLWRQSTVANLRISHEKDQAVAARNDAQRAAQRALAVLRFQRRMLASVRPGEDGRNVKVADILQRAVGELDAAFSDQPGVAAAVRLTIGETYHALGMFPDAERQLTRAVEASRGSDSDPADHWIAVLALAGLRIAQDQLDEAEALLQSATEPLRALNGSDDSYTLLCLRYLAQIRCTQGRLDEAERLADEAWRACQSSLGAEHPETLDAAGLYGSVLIKAGKLAEAERVLRAVLEQKERVLHPEHPETLVTKSNLAVVLYHQGRMAEGLAVIRSVVTTQERVLGPDHEFTLSSLATLATFLAESGQLTEAVVIEQRLAAARSRVLGPEHADTLSTKSSLAKTLHDLKRFDEADALAREALQGRERTLGKANEATLLSRIQVGVFLLDGNRAADALPFLEGAATDAREALGEDHWLTGMALRNWGDCLVAIERYEEAEEHLLAAYDILVAALNERHARTQQSVRSLVALYHKWEKPDAETEWRARLARP